MNENIPWGRIAVEGIVIVASILLAFGIEAWWDGSQALDRERSYLMSLRQEFTVALQQTATPMRGHAVHSAEALINQAQGSERAPLDSLYLWASGLSQQIEFDPPRAVLDDLISSGETQLIQSDSLRLALASYPAFLDQLRAADARAWATWEQRMQPFLEGRIPRVDRLRRGSFGTLRDGSVRSLPFGPSPHGAEWDAVLLSPSFEDMLAERWMRLEQGGGDSRRRNGSSNASFA